MLPSKGNKMSSDRWQQLYSKSFVLIVLASMLFTMVKSLQSGCAKFDESFLGKARLISTFNHLRYSMGDEVFPQVQVGKDGWLEFSSAGNLDDYQNASIDPERLERIRQKLDTLNAKLAARGITLLVVVAPNKETIYPDIVSEKLEKINEKSRLDVFLDLIRQTNSPPVIDLRPALRLASQNHQLYFKTDSHWNSLGSYFAYYEIMKALSQEYPMLQPYELDQFRWEESDPIVMDLPKLIGADFIKEPWNQLRPKFNSASYRQQFSNPSTVWFSWAYNGQEKTLLMYHDSFGNRLQSLLQHHFKAAMYIPNANPEPPKSSWVDLINPDIVIIEVVERNLIFLDGLLLKLLEHLS